jgi:hypothetical protein
VEGVSRWFEGVKLAGDGTQGPPDHELMREVNHATGNLVHRMFYWAELLGDRPPEEDLKETVEHLKDSLGELHRLVSRTFDLVRAVEVRPLGVAANDLVESIALRLGTRADFGDAPELEDDLAGQRVSVDPLLVDRAMGLVAEALSLTRGDAEPESPACSLRVRASEPMEGDAGSRDGILLHYSAGAKVTHSCAQPGSEVAEAVSIALARKLLAALGWLIDLDEVNGERRLAIFVPLSSSPELTTSVSLS